MLRPYDKIVGACPRQGARQFIVPDNQIAQTQGLVIVAGLARTAPDVDIDAGEDHAMIRIPGGSRKGWPSEIKYSNMILTYLGQFR